MHASEDYLGYVSLVLVSFSIVAAEQDFMAVSVARALFCEIVCLAEGETKMRS